MIAVIFEFTPKSESRDTYLDLAAEMRPLVEKIDGFISVERFQSITNPEKLLSLSIWRDEEAVREWRNLAAHRSVQQQGRDTLFADYRLRVAGIFRDYSLFERDEAPEDSRSHHDQAP